MEKTRTSKRAYRGVVLSALPGSNADVRAKTGLGLATVSRWLNDLLKAEEIHLHHMEVSPTGGPLISVFHPGPAPAGFKPKIPKLPTDTERTARYRRNARKSGAWEDIKAKRRAKYHANKKPKRDPLTAALFGATP